MTAGQTLASRGSGVEARDSFAPILQETRVEALAMRSVDATDADVSRALSRTRRTPTDLAALLSPAASARLEEVAAAAHRLTLQRFGRTVRLFAPVYVSSECVSSCTYCGFSKENTDIIRKTLSPAEVLAEARLLLRRGFRHILLVSGEHPRIVSKEYLAACIETLAPEIPSVSIEVQTWDTETYRRFATAGCEGVVCYQETYDRDVYAAVHLKGKKRNYEWRLDAPSRAGLAGMRRLGIGALLGLAPHWRPDVLALATHAAFLQRRFWRSAVTVALPRLRPCAGGFESQWPVGDRDFVQAICALRLFLPDTGIVLSTREAPALRDGLLRIGVTHMSAGSATEPGGYSAPQEAEPQFAIEDTRPPDEVASVLRASGYDPVWTDPIVRTALDAAPAGRR